MGRTAVSKKMYLKLSILFLLAAVTLCLSSCKSPQKVQEKPAMMGGESKLYSITMNDIDGRPVSLSEYKGKVILIVNVASECRFTKQYKDLEKLYKRYEKRGFVILGFPANNFGGQEPGTDAQIKELTTTEFGITFPMFSKTSVVGDDINPLYAYLTSREEDPKFGGPITWNFTKFLIDRNGRVVGRFYPETPPFDKEIVKAIKETLKEPQ
jgi:glutathione peroxidase-family protein